MTTDEGYTYRVFYRLGEHSVTVQGKTAEELVDALNVVEQGQDKIKQLGDLLSPPRDFSDPIATLNQGGIKAEVLYQGETKTCQHGAMVYREGPPKNGKKGWKAFMCTAPKGYTCDPIWI